MISWLWYKMSRERFFLYDLKAEEISYKYRFRTKGDFEGVEVVGDHAYAIRSDGCIYEIKDFKNAEKAVVKRFENFLNIDNDTEGLALGPYGDNLLVACKSSASNPKKSYSGKRSVYAFDLARKSLEETPRVLIDIDLLEEKTGKKDQRFRPSGIAIHPTSRDIYTIASSGQLMVILSPKGEVKWIKHLDKDIFRQPEGICFSPNGDLYISNEGRGKKGNVLLFESR